MLQKEAMELQYKQYVGLSLHVWIKNQCLWEENGQLVHNIFCNVSFIGRMSNERSLGFAIEASKVWYGWMYGSKVE